MITARRDGVTFVSLDLTEAAQVLDYLPWSTYVILKLNRSDVENRDLAWLCDQYRYFEAVLRNAIRSPYQNSAERLTISAAMATDTVRDAMFIDTAEENTRVIFGITEETTTRIQTVLDSSTMARLWTTLDTRFRYRFGTRAPTPEARTVAGLFCRAVSGLPVAMSYAAMDTSRLINRSTDRIFAALFAVAENLAAIQSAVRSWIDNYTRQRNGIKPEWLAKYLGVKEVYVGKQNSPSA